MNQTPIPNNSTAHKAAGNLAFLLSVIRCGEPLHSDEEAHVREIIDQLELEDSEALKGICVYCGAVEQYESLEQKAGDEGNRMRIAHIRQCAARPELKLIACVEETIAALKQWVHWYAVDSTEFNRDSAYDTTLALLEKYQRAKSEPRNEVETDAVIDPLVSQK
jgi:hypothetical protein